MAPCSPSCARQRTSSRFCLKPFPLAAINTPTACVASGPREAIAALELRLAEKGISATLLHTSHAFHSAMLEPAVRPFIEFMHGIELKPPQMPYVSNVTGEWITDAQATSASYWGAHMRAPVLFYKGLTCIANHASTAFLEVGPGRSLGTLARSLGREVSDNVILIVHGARGGARRGRSQGFLTGRGGALGHRCADRLETAGTKASAAASVPLPTYPFERKKYWILDDERPAPAQTKPASDNPGPVVAQSRYTVETATWKRIQYSTPARTNADQAALIWLVFVTTESVDQRVANAFRNRGDKVIVVEKGTAFTKLDEGRFSCDPNQEANIDELCSAIAETLATDQLLRVVYFCSPSRPAAADQVASQYRREVNDKINAPIALIRSLTRHAKNENIVLTVVTRDGQEITGRETINPMMALPIGPCLAGTHEYPGLNCRIVDITSQVPVIEQLAHQLAADLAEPRPSVVTAYRGNARWARIVEPIPAFLLKNSNAAFRKDGVYLITGGLGALGLAVGKHLAENYQANLILISRTSLPAREDWNKIQAQDDNRLARIVRGITEIEAAGGKVMVGAADVCDLAQMQDVVHEAYDRFGGVHGVIHAAGVPGNTPIGLKTLQEVDQVLYPKILGLAVLEQIFADRSLDFLALFSSTSALWGRVGQVDYTAANAYLDAYAIASWGKANWPTVSINWDNWREVGMAVDTHRTSPGQDKQLRGLSTADGVRASRSGSVGEAPAGNCAHFASTTRKPGAGSILRQSPLRGHRRLSDLSQNRSRRAILARRSLSPIRHQRLNSRQIWRHYGVNC